MLNEHDPKEIHDRFVSKKLTFIIISPRFFLDRDELIIGMFPSLFYIRKP